jgi:hypothetical protein
MDEPLLHPRDYPNFTPWQKRQASFPEGWQFGVDPRYGWLPFVPNVDAPDGPYIANPFLPPEQYGRW